MRNIIIKFFSLILFFVIVLLINRNEAFALQPGECTACNDAVAEAAGCDGGEVMPLYSDPCNNSQSRCCLAGGPPPTDSGGNGGENSGVQTGLNVKCNCNNKTYNSCGNYYGLINIKYRGPCTPTLTGPDTCNAKGGNNYYQYQSCAAAPTATPVPGGGAPTATPVPPARPSLCSSATISKASLAPGDSLTITSTANTSDIKKFSYYFYNPDNLVDLNDPRTSKPIYFVANTHYSKHVDTSPPINSPFSRSVTLSYNEDLNRPDLNWGGKNPERISVSAYFVNSAGGFSAADGNCVKLFYIKRCCSNINTSASDRN